MIRAQGDIRLNREYNPASLYGIIFPVEEDLNKLLKAAKDKIARYADISLIIIATDNGEYLGSLHRTYDPIDLAMAIPSELLASGNPVYILRLHNGVVERLQTTVRDGRAYFASDLFSKFALAYDLIESKEDPEPSEDETKTEDKTSINPANPGSGDAEPAKTGVIKTNTRTGTKPSAKQKVQTAVITVKPAKTGDTSNVNLWLVLMFLSVCAALSAVFSKKTIKM